MTGPWEAESEDERGVVRVASNLNSSSHGVILPTADAEAMLRSLTVIDYNNRNWSWLLDPNMSPKPPVILKVPSSNKIQAASKPEEPT